MRMGEGCGSLRLSTTPCIQCILHGHNESDYLSILRCAVARSGSNFRLVVHRIQRGHGASRQLTSAVAVLVLNVR